MQASKIIIGHEYAVKTGPDSFKAFRVDQVISIRSGSNNTTSKVKGFYRDDDRQGELPVDRLAGPVEEYAALMAEKLKAEKEKKEAEQAKIDLARKAAKLLAEAMGIKLDLNDYRSPIQARYGNSVEINHAVLPALIAFLEKSKVDA